MKPNLDLKLVLKYIMIAIVLEILFQGKTLGSFTPREAFCAIFFLREVLL